MMTSPLSPAPRALYNGTRRHLRGLCSRARFLKCSGHSASVPRFRRLRLFLVRKQTSSRLPASLPGHNLIHYPATRIQSPKNSGLALVFRLASGCWVHISCRQYFRLASFNFLGIMLSGRGGQLLVYLYLSWLQIKALCLKKKKKGKANFPFQCPSV